MRDILGEALAALATDWARAHGYPDVEIVATKKDDPVLWAQNEVEGEQIMMGDQTTAHLHYTA